MGMRVVAVVVLAWCGLAGCGDSRVPPTVAVEAPAQPVIGKARTRYQFNGQCVALRLEASGRYVTAASGGYRASAADAAQAEGFRLQASALGRYLIDGLDGSLLSASGMAVAPVALASAGDGAEWTLRGATDTVLYPNAPEVDAPADVTALAAYRAFVDPESRHERWHWRAAGGQGLAADSSGVLVLAATPSVFLLEALPTERCAVFAEAQDNVVGETFKGTRPDGTVTGWADTHLHATSTSFLGGAKPGFPFHRFGVTHALASCEVEHGPTGQRDVVGSLFTSDFDGHATDGWPTFTDWPSRTATTHEATYYKWIERAWKSGLRLIVNFAVDNGTLCEIERNAAGTPARNCNEMVNALQQLGTAHAMQDYIDAQYGGRGAGWWRIVTTPGEARRVIAEGKVAVLLGVEVSNLLDCTLRYNPASTQEAFEETGSATAGGQTYGCRTSETGAPDEIATQLTHLRALGVTNLFTVHEFDNAIGGSDLFDGTVLNLGTKENTGGLGPLDRSAAAAAFPAQASAIGHFEANGLGTGEFWSTYDCPGADSPETGGFVFPAIGAVMTNFGPPRPACPYTGQGGRAGGSTACYPAAPQCNARLLTPLGLAVWKKIMEMGFIFEADHLAFAQRDQLLDLAAAQTPNYPVVSAHGFSGLSMKQAQRIYAGGGLVYPTYNDTNDFLSLWRKLKPLWRAANAPGPFGFGFGTDTNGLSPQAAPRATIAQGRELRYPFTLFRGPGFDGVPEFAALPAITFEQPSARAPDGRGRSWHEDIDGNAHYGMAADSIEELRLEGGSEPLRDVYHSAEAYLRFWERTQAASAGVRAKGLVVPPGLLRAAPKTP